MLYVSFKEAKSLDSAFKSIIFLLMSSIGQRSGIQPGVLESASTKIPVLLNFPITPNQQKQSHWIVARPNLHLDEGNTTLQHPPCILTRTKPLKFKKASVRNTCWLIRLFYETLISRGIFDGAIVDPHGYLDFVKTDAIYSIYWRFPHHWTISSFVSPTVNKQLSPNLIINLKKIHHQLENLCSWLICRMSADWTIYNLGPA